MCCEVLHRVRMKARIRRTHVTHVFDGFLDLFELGTERWLILGRP
jgi:hypothetical protein